MPRPSPEAPEFPPNSANHWALLNPEKGAHGNWPIPHCRREFVRNRPAPMSTPLRTLVAANECPLSPNVPMPARRLDRPRVRNPTNSANPYPRLSPESRRPGGAPISRIDSAIFERLRESPRIMVSRKHAARFLNFRTARRDRGNQEAS